MTTHEYYMHKALQEARQAAEEGEIPVGAVVVCKGKIIARAHNETEKLNDVTAHAEMLAITMAASYLGGKYLNECTLYVTMEPCTMCAGATRRISDRSPRPSSGILASDPSRIASENPNHLRHFNRGMQ